MRRRVAAPRRLAGIHHEAYEASCLLHEEESDPCSYPPAEGYEAAVLEKPNEPDSHRADLAGRVPQ